MLNFAEHVQTNRHYGWKIKKRNSGPVQYVTPV